MDPTRTPTRQVRSGTTSRAYRLFFPLACLYGAAAVAVWVGEWNGWLGGCANCDAVVRHGHEMLLGYAGAIIAGYLFTRITRRQLVLAVGCWLLGRGSAWGEWQGIGGVAAALAFPAILFLLGGMPFWRAARTARNMVFAPLIAGFAAAEALVIGGNGHGGVMLAFDLVAMLILVMGGRLIPGGMAGLVRREEGHDLFDSNQRRLEWVCVAGLAMAAVTHALSLADTVAAMGYLAAATAAGLRQARWRPRLAVADASLGPLQVGYCLLAVGLAATALAAWTAVWPAADAFHLATIGGLGVITTTMMLRSAHIRERCPPPFPRMAWPVAILLAMAATVRAAVPLAPVPLLMASALLWSAALFATAVAMALMAWRSKSE